MQDSQNVRCAACGATNRVPVAKLQQGLTPVCGKCKAPLTMSTGPLTVTDASFASQVEAAPLPVLVDMWAPWCGPCRTIAPIVEELAHEWAGRMVVGKLNIDDNPMVASRFNVRSIPALLLFKNGREVDRIVGAQPKSEIVRKLEMHAK